MGVNNKEVKDLVLNKIDRCCMLVEVLVEKTVEAIS